MYKSDWSVQRAWGKYASNSHDPTGVIWKGYLKKIQFLKEQKYNKQKTSQID